MLLLVGAGEMACEYAKILKSLCCEFSVIGRGDKSADQFYKKVGIRPIVGGIQSNIHKCPQIFSSAIVAVGVDSIYDTTMALLDAGIKKILVEKPGGVNLEEIRKLHRSSIANGAMLFVGYNRRFYSSVLTAKEMIKGDAGGVESFSFEFTEWSHIVKDLPTNERIKDKWFLANSTHVVDLAFYLGGEPDSWNHLVNGECDWHKSGSIFVGSGVSSIGALFSYHANWNSAGRWGVEILTKERRYILRPLEELWVARKGSVNIEKVDFNNKNDTEYKPGIFLQTEAFLKGDYNSLCTISEQLNRIEKYYYPMAGYR